MTRVAIARARVTINRRGNHHWEQESDARVWKEAKRLLDHRIIDRVSSTCGRFVVAFEREKILEEVLSKENDGMTRVRRDEQRREVSLSGGDAANSHIICSLLIHWTQQ